jgi:hypothetical protein
LNTEKQQELFSQMLATGNFENLIDGINPDQQKRLFELVLKRLAAGLTEETTKVNDRN